MRNMLTASRLKDLSLDILAGLSFALVATLVVAQPAWAYVDPSVMTYTIQALAGVAVALSAVAGVALRRTRKVIMAKLNIDENANKNVESVVHRLDAQSKQPIQNSCDPLEQERLSRPKKPNPLNEPLAVPGRLILAFLSCFFLFFTLFMVAPYELVASNGRDLLFQLDAIWAPMAIFTAILTVVVALVMSALRGKVFDIAFASVTALGVACWIEAMFLNTRLPIADGAFLFWPDFTDMFIISTIAWVVIIAAIIALMVKKKPIARVVCTFLCAALIIMQAVGVASLSFAPQQKGPEEFWDGNYTTQEGMYDLSDKSNVVVFVLDMFDCKDLDRIRKESPETLSEMTGFSAFTDSVGSFIPTRYGVPYLLTGEFPHDTDTWAEFLDNRYKRSSLIKDVYNAGYSVGIYSTNIENGTDDVAPFAFNIHHLNKKDDPKAKVNNLDAVGTVKALAKCALYRDLPWIAKPTFWFYTDEINDMMAVKPPQGRENKDYSVLPYRINDMEFYDNLKTDKLVINDSGTKGAFRFIHLEGAHWPYVMDENGNRANTNIEQQSRGALHIVSEYLKQMKELGVYDNATIIITSDHGVWEWAANNASMASNGNISTSTAPFMMVKPAGAENKPCVFSDAQTGHIDYPATLIQAVGGNWEAYGTTVFQAPTSGRERFSFITEFDGHEDDGIRKFVINGPVMDLSSWHATETYWPADSTIYGHKSA